MNTTKNRQNSKINIHINKTKSKKTLTRNLNDQQRLCLEFILRDHRVLFIKLIRNINQN